MCANIFIYRYICIHMPDARIPGRADPAHALHVPHRRVRPSPKPQTLTPNPTPNPTT